MVSYSNESSNGLTPAIRVPLAAEVTTMFVFFSNRLGCLTSIVISIILSALLILLLRGCSGTSY
jgi:hypothetical protein